MPGMVKSPMDRLAQVALEQPEHMVARALDTAREMLDMEVAYLTEITPAEQRFVAASGPAADVGCAGGTAIPLQDSYCEKLLDGRIGNIVVDTTTEPAIAQVPLTAEHAVRSYVGVPVQYSDGRVCGTLCCISRATDPAVAERDLRFMNVLARLVADELERQELRAETDRLKDDFLALTSHELRTPLASIAGFVEVLLQDEAHTLSEEGQDFLETIDGSVRRLQRMVDQLMFVARAQADRLVPEIVECDLGVIAASAVTSARPAAAAGEVAIDVESPEPVPLRGDADQLQRLADNLVSNAVKYTPAGGEVHVRASLDGDAAVLEVRDTGCGIPADEQERLFERFFRASTARDRQVQGVGLGLWICRAIAEGHGGRIDVDSAAGQGSRFRVALPRAGLSGKEA